MAQNNRDMTGTNAVITMMITIRRVMVVTVGACLVCVSVRRVNIRMERGGGILGAAHIHTRGQPFSKVEQGHQSCQDDMDKTKAH